MKSKKQLTHTALENRIIAFLKKNLPHPRFLHSLNVMRIAGDLAQRYGENILAARIAGLLHDCARGLPFKTMRNYARHYNPAIMTDYVVAGNPKLLHGSASAYIAQKKFHITDKKILHAIARHTVAVRSMTILDMIIYMADITAPDRRFKYVKTLRVLVKRDLKKAFEKALAQKITFVLNHRLILHPDAAHAWNTLLAQHS